MRAKRVVGWIGAGVAVLILVVLVGGFIVLRTPQFHRYVLAKIMEEGQTSTGGRLVIQNWDYHLSPLTVDLYGITLRGNESGDQKPLLQADKLTVGVSGHALLHQKLQLTELLIQHPVLNVQVNKDGQSNIPTPPTQKTKSNTTIWSLAVGHALLTNGEVYYNDQQTPLSADLYDLRTEIRFDPSATRYTGNLSYQNGTLQYTNYSPLPHNLQAQFSATPQGASLNPLVLTLGQSRISLHGNMDDYNNPKVNAAYEMAIHTQDFASMSPSASPAGDLQLAGKLEYQGSPGQALLRTVTLNGNLESGELRIVSSDGRVVIRKLSGEYHLANGNLTARTISGDLFNGQVVTNLSMQNLDTKPVSKLEASLQHISLESARESIRRAEVRKMPVTGVLDGSLQATWTESFKNLRAFSDLQVRAAIWNNSTRPPSGTPVNALAHVNYEGSRNIISFRETTLRIPSTSVIVDGQLSEHSNLNIHAVAGDLHQLVGLATSLQKGTSESAQKPILSGSARLNAVVQGSMQRPHISGQLSAQDLEVQGSRWSSADMTFAANPDQITVQNASLVNAKQGTVNLSAQVALKNWAYEPSSPIHANLSAKKMSIADLEHLANQQYPISGTLSADMSFQGTQNNPSGHGSLQVVKASAYNEPIQNLTLRFQAQGDSIASQLDATLPAGSATASLTFVPKTKAYELHLNIPTISLQRLQTVQAKNLPISGTFTAAANGKGTLDNPQLTASFSIPQLQTRQTAINQIKAEINVANQRASFSLGSDVSQAHLDAKGVINLNGDYYTEASVDTSRIPLAPLLATYASSVPEGLQGATEVHASLKGPLKDPSKVEAHLTIPTLTASYQSMQIGNVTPIRADYSNATLVIQPAQIRGTDTSLSIEGRIPIQGNSAMSVNARGSVDLVLLSMFSSDIKSGGTIGLEVQGSGDIHHPDVRGQIQIKDVALSTPDTPVGMERLNGLLDVTADRLQIRNLTGRMGGGDISAGGSIAYRPNLQFNVGVQSKSVRLLYPTGVRTLLDSNLTFTGNTDASTLGGRVTIDSLTFTPDFDLSTFASQFNGTSLPPSGTSFADNVKLGIAVQSKSNLSARSSQVSLEGAVNLQVIGTASNPVIVGRTDLTSGELFFMNNRYALQRGIITFDNPNQTTPVLNVQATTTVQQYNVTITLNGPIDKLNTSYTSDPPLATADVISLLYQGQTTEQAAAQGTSTDSFIAGQAASQVSSGIQKLAGISSLQIDPLIGGSNANPSARIALQQRVTKNFLFSFSTDVSQPGDEIVSGEYQLTPRWSVMVTRDQLGGVSVDGRFHTKF